MLDMIRSIHFLLCRQTLEVEATFLGPCAKGGAGGLQTQFRLRNVWADRK